MGLHTVLWGTMEPEGRPLTPGTSYGPPPPFNSAQNPTFLNCTLQVRPRHTPSSLSVPRMICNKRRVRHFQASCSPNARGGPTWGHAGDEGPEQAEGADQGRSAQRRFRSSAFPSSLSWDSDSEKETLDGNTWLHIYWETCCTLTDHNVDQSIEVEPSSANTCDISSLSLYCFKCHSVCM